MKEITSLLITFNYLVYILEYELITRGDRIATALILK